MAGVRRTLHFFYPGKAFPSVSITGNECKLSCKHCSGHYLGHMIDARDPEDLLRFAFGSKDILGFLLSGGCQNEGRLDFSRHLQAVKRITTETDLVVNVHTGMIELEGAKELVEAGLMLASVDVVGDPEVVKEVYGVEAVDPAVTLKALKEAGFSTIVPHVCIGLKGGILSHEFKALEKIKSSGVEPAAIVFISLIPTRGTEYENSPVVGDDDQLKVIETARDMFPDTPLMLGCMRSKKDRNIEKLAILSGVDGVVLPSKQTIEWAQEKGFFVKRHDTCCALIGIALGTEL